MGKKARMPEVRHVAEEEIGAAQAAALTVLLGLEARWENLRATRAGPSEAVERFREMGVGTQK